MQCIMKPFPVILDTHYDLLLIHIQVPRPSFDENASQQAAFDRHVRAMRTGKVSKEKNGARG